jgi:hypothetical protein
MGTEARLALSHMLIEVQRVVDQLRQPMSKLSELQDRLDLCSTTAKVIEDTGVKVSADIGIRHANEATFGPLRRAILDLDADVGDCREAAVPAILDAMDRVRSAQAAAGG